MARSTSVSESPSSAEKKNRTSAVIVSMSASVGTTRSNRPRSAATAENSALAGAVRPETRRAGTPRRRRLAADFRSERSVSELEVYDDTASGFVKAGTFYFSHCRLPAQRAPQMTSDRLLAMGRIVVRNAPSRPILCALWVERRHS